MKILNKAKYSLKYTKMLDLMPKKKYIDAIGLYNEIKYIDIDIWRAHFAASECYHIIGEKEKSIEAARLAVEGIYNSGINDDEKSHLFIYIHKTTGAENPLIVDFFKERGGFFEPDNNNVRESFKWLAPMK